MLTTFYSDKEVLIVFFLQIITDWPCVLKNKAVYFVKREKVREESIELSLF